jgi:hypothetical protein
MFDERAVAANEHDENGLLVSEAGERNRAAGDDVRQAEIRGSGAQLEHRRERFHHRDPSCDGIISRWTLHIIITSGPQAIAVFASDLDGVRSRPACMRSRRN